MRIEMPQSSHPLPPSEQLQCCPKLQGGCTRHWPGAVIGIPDSVAAIEETEFSIPVVQSEKTEYDYRRLQLCEAGIVE